MTRTHERFIRGYVDGYDLSDSVSDFGSIGAKFDVQLIAAYSDAVKNALAGRPSLQCGPIQGFLSPSAATGLHELTDAGCGTRDIMVALGIGAVPAAGNPMFAWKFEQNEYTSSKGSGAVAINLAFAGGSYAGILNYQNPWGFVVHPAGSETTANTAITTIDDNGAASALGGIFVYHLFSSNGTCTLSLDDSATNANNAAFVALSGATSGSIDASVTPKHGMIVLSKTATVRRYIRWQIALGTATTANFVCGFIRANI